MKLKRIFILVLVVVLLCSVLAGCFNGGHAPGYGNTSKCTICKKPATHKTSNYGFCDKHWEDAIS